MKLFAASIIATHCQTKEARHELFTFSMRENAELTPEGNAMTIAQSLLPKGEAFEYQLKVVLVDIAKHYRTAEFQESKEA